MDKHRKYQIVRDMLESNALPFYDIIVKENEQKKPSQVLIEYCQRRINAIGYVIEHLSADDEGFLDRAIAEERPFRTL